MSTTPAALLRHIRQLAAARDADPRTDRELLHRFTTQRDEAAFATLLRRHGSMVLNTCRRILHREADTEDAFQATFLVLLRQAEHRSWRESLGGWLHGVAVRVALRMRAQAARRSSASKSIEQNIDADPLENLSARELFAVLDEELAQLPLTYREPLVLCHLQGKTQEEASRQLGCSLSTIRRRLEAGRKRLHRRLSRRGVTLSAALGALLLSQSTSTACVPFSLLHATVQAARSGTIAARLAVVIDGVAKAAVWTPMKTATALLLTLSVLAAGAGLGVSYPAPKPPAAAANEPISELPAKSNGDKKERVDRYGDPLPPGALLRLGTLRFRHDTFLCNLAYSPDGKILAAGGSDNGAILLYDAATGRKLRQLQARTKFPALTFSPDGKLLASAGKGGVQIWDTDTGKEMRRPDYSSTGAFEYRERMAVPLAFSRDGKSLAGVGPGYFIHIWDTKSGKRTGKLFGHQSPIRCLSFSADGTKLFSASASGGVEGLVCEWDLGTGKESRRFLLPRDTGLGERFPLCFSPDGKVLLCSIPERMQRKKGNAVIAFTGQVISLLDLATGKMSRKLEVGDHELRAAAFSRDGKMIATMSRQFTGVVHGHALFGEPLSNIKLWDARTGKLLFDLPHFAEKRGFAEGGPNLLAFAPDGRQLAAIGGGSGLHVWDLPPNGAPHMRAEAHHDIVQRAVFSPDGRTLATASSDHTIALWDADTGRHRLRLRGQAGAITSLTFSPDGKLLASASTGFDLTVRLWTAATGKQIRQHEVPPYVTTGNNEIVLVTTYVSFASDGKMLAASGTDRKLRLWKVADGKEIHDQPVRGLRASPNAKPRDLYQWPKGIRDIAFTPDGRMMALGVGDKTLCIADVASGQALFQYQAAEMPTVLALSPDGKTLLYSSGKSFRLVESASGAELHKVDLPDTVYAAAFAADGRTLAVGIGDKRARIYLFDVPSGKEILRLQGHESRVLSLDFSPDGMRLASAQWDSTALVWDVSATRRKLAHKDLAPPDLDRLWSDLAEKDAGKAHAALWTLAASPEQAVPYLQKHLHPTPRIEAECLRRLLADLDGDDFQRRQEAARQLAKRGSEIEPALRHELQKNPSPELRRRVDELLRNLPCQTAMTPEALRQLRTIRVLEQIGSPEARQVLQSLAEGAAAAPATRDAQAALARSRTIAARSRAR